MTPEKVPVERRFHTRHRARTEVFIRQKSGKSKRCKVVNLSVNGVAIHTADMGLGKGEVVELSFAINLGPVIKIHRRKARVAYIRNGITGFAMENFGKR